MDYINKALDAITKTGNEVGQKAKGTAEIVKLKNKIMAKENAIKAIYSEIGKYVYENLKEDAPEEIAAKMEQIDADLAEIAKCKEEIYKLKGVNKCENCGKEVNSTFAFCPGCGNKMPEPVVEPVFEDEVTEITDEEVCNECETMEDFGETCAEAVEDVKEEIAEAVKDVCEACEGKVDAFTE